MTFKFPVIELVDRYTIARVKYRKTNGANQAELDFYTEQLAALDVEKIASQLTELEKIHDTIWGMEDDFKKCRIDGVSLAEVGRRAIAIRDLNNHRVAFKNSIADLLNDPVKEIKQ